MPAVPRIPSSGAPTANAAGDPTYGQGTLTYALSRVAPVIEQVTTSSNRIAQAQRTYVSPVDGASIPAVQAHTPSADAVYTGAVAQERAAYLGTQVANATGTSAATATEVVRDYHNRTGSFPDLSQLGSLGSGYTGGAVDLGAGGAGVQEAGVLGGGLNTWILLGALGLVAVLLFGKKGR